MIPLLFSLAKWFRFMTLDSGTQAKPPDLCPVFRFAFLLVLQMRGEGKRHFPGANQSRYRGSCCVRRFAPDKCADKAQQ
jgi:hypothetical protein